MGQKPKQQVEASCQQNMGAHLYDSPSKAMCPDYNLLLLTLSLCEYWFCVSVYVRLLRVHSVCCLCYLCSLCAFVVCTLPFSLLFCLHCVVSVNARRCNVRLLVCARQISLCVAPLFDWLCIYACVWVLRCVWLCVSLLRGSFFYKWITCVIPPPAPLEAITVTVKCVLNINN